MNRSKLRKTYGFGSLLSSEWSISLLLSYLSLNDIAKLDSCICNHEDRKKFLECFSNLIIEIDLQKIPTKIINVESMIDWIVCRKLNLRKISLVLVHGYVNISDISISQLVKHNPNIKELMIKGTIRNNDPNKVSLKLLFTTLGEYCPLIEKFSCVQPFNEKLELADSQIVYFLKSCRNLKSLNINAIEHGKTSNILQYLSKYNCLIETLEIWAQVSYDNDSNKIYESLTIKPFEDLFKGCPFLKEISFYYYKFSAQILSKLVHIEKLQFHDCDISNEAYADIGQLSELKSLRFSYMYQMTALSITHLFSGNFNRVLLKLYILACSQFSDSDVLLVAASCPYLKTFSITRSENITDNGISNLFLPKHRTALEEIDIDNCSNISNHSIFNIAANCSHLQFIYITDMRNITPASLLELVDKCKNLMYLKYSIENKTSLTPIGLEVKSIRAQYFVSLLSNS